MGLHTLAREVPALDHRIRESAATDGSADGRRGRDAMTDRDHDEHRDSPGEATPEEPTADEGQEAPDAAPKPATWAGRQRSPGEDAGEPEEIPAEEAKTDDAADEEPAEEDGGSEPGGEEAEDAEPDTAERAAQDTVEAATLALADREAAREAALAGLRARAAENKTKHGTESITAPPPKTGVPEDGKPDKKEPTGQTPPVTPPPAAAIAAAQEPARRGLWPRFVAGSLLIIVAMATATSVSLFFFINGVLADFHGVPGVENALTVAHPGQPQTILVLGSDERPTSGEIAHSDTAILLRIASDQISVLSIPRDLKVNIPG